MKAIHVGLTCVAVLTLAATAMADPLPGQELKFSQMPMIATPIPPLPDPGGTETIYYGHDEVSTAWWNPEGTVDPVYEGVFMADDFADRVRKEVAHVRWWGSYPMLPAGDDRRVDRFLIAFENDIPADSTAGPYPFSHPDCWGGALNTQISIRDADGVHMPGEGTFTERLVPGSNPNEPVYEYNAELLCPFPQMADTVYWLKIVALVDLDPASPDERLTWGWHNRDYTLRDPFASVFPDVDPGEHIQGWLDPNGTPDIPDDDIPIWHFQDDAVSGAIEGIFMRDLCDVHMDQDHWVSTDPSLVAEHYVDDVDGPVGIGEYSKDLAFELFTPEPATLALMGLGVAGLVASRRRRRT